MAGVSDMSGQVNALNSAFGNVHRSVQGVGHGIDEVSKSIFSLGKTIGVLGAASVLRFIGQWGLEQVRSQKQYIADGQKRLEQLNMLIRSERERRIEAKKEGESKEELTIIRNHITSLIEVARQEKLQKGFREQMVELAKKEGLAASVKIAYLIQAQHWLVETLKTAHEYNRALIQTSSDAGMRYALIGRTLGVQQQLGASTNTMAESVQALVGYGGALNSAFSENLKVIVQMRDGLGVAAHSAAEMVTVFTRQLKTPAREVADIIAEVAANTGLSGEKLTNFAVEAGRAMRLLGPGINIDVKGVEKTLATLAGRIHGIGGNSQMITDFYALLTNGSGKSMQVRGMLGANSQALGSPEGTLKVFQNLSNFISTRLVNSGAQYGLVLTQLSEDLGISASSAKELMQVMQEWNSTTNTSRTVAQAYTEQTRLIGKSWKQIKDSLGALVREALLPFVEYMQPVIESLADFVKGLTDFELMGIKPLVWTLRIVLPVAAVAAVVSLVALGLAIKKMAADNAWASAQLAFHTGGFKDTLKTVFDMFKSGGVLSAPLKAGLGGLSATVTRGIVAGSAVTSVVSLGIVAPLLAVGGALIAGVAVGTLINKLVLSNLKNWAAAWKSNKEENATLTGTPNSPYNVQAYAAELQANRLLGKGSKSVADAAANQAIALNEEKYGWNAERTWTAILHAAVPIARDLLKVRSYQGPTLKSEEDKVRDKENNLALKQVDILEASLQVSQNRERLAKDQLKMQALQKQKDDARMDNERMNYYWNLMPAYDNKAPAR